MTNSSVNVSPYQAPKKKMTDDEIDTLRTQVPDDPIKLPEGHLACELCGVATAAKPTTSVPLRWASRKTDEWGHENYIEHLHLTRCESCTSIRQRADEMVAAAPHLAARLGPQLAQEHVENVLVAYAVLGRTPPADLAIVVHRVQHVGGLARYHGPSRLTVGLCSPRPWAHVTVKQRAAIRLAAAVVLRDRVALNQPPTRLQCPSRGCLLCGVGTVAMSALGVVRAGGQRAATRTVWRPVSSDRRTLGGRSQDPVNGHLCPACTRARDDVGGIGLSARERAVVDHVQGTRGIDAALRLRDLLVEQTGGGGFRPALAIPAWGAFQGSPNHSPWAHLSKVLDNL